MVTVMADQQKVRFYGSPDLKLWTHLSDFGPAGQVDNEWECPDLFQMDVEGQPGEKKWILKVDVNHSILGQYFIGHFDGTRFINDHSNDHVLRIDSGKDFYVAQSWSDAPNNRHIWIGWMNNWDYAKVIPTSPWRGMFSVPREVQLMHYPEGLRLIQKPVEELTQLRQSFYHVSDGDIVTVNTQLDTLKMDVAQEIQAEFALDTAYEFEQNLHR
jgi:sucrose-6-phosphate hydrolase SacC (GH32 family)